MVRAAARAIKSDVGDRTPPRALEIHNFHIIPCISRNSRTEKNALRDAVREERCFIIVFSVSGLVSMGTRAQIDSRYLKTNNLCAALSDYFGVDLCVLFVGFAPWWCFITAVISLPDIT